MFFFSPPCDLRRRLLLICQRQQLRGGVFFFVSLFLFLLGNFSSWISWFFLGELGYGVRFWGCLQKGKIKKIDFNFGGWIFLFFFLPCRCSFYFSFVDFVVRFNLASLFTFFFNRCFAWFVDPAEKVLGIEGREKTEGML